MSHENVEFLRQGYEALQRGDIEAFKALARISPRGGGSGVPVAQELAVVWTEAAERG